MTAIPEHIMEEAQDVAFDCDPTKTSDQIANTIALALLAAEKRGREEERERCARIVDESGGLMGRTSVEAAAAIRSGQ